MNASQGPTQRVTDNLRRAIDDLRRDIRRVEIWADALNGFAQPVAEYDIPGVRILGRPKDR